MPHDEGKIDTITNDINDVVGTVHHLSETVIIMSLQVLESLCGLNHTAATALQGGAALLHNASHAFNNGFNEVRHILECRTFNPIYTAFVHDAICVEGVYGLTWLFSTSLLLSLFAMVMIMFRAGLYPVMRPLAETEKSALGVSLLSKSGC